jgi:hypothetical protein
MANISLDQLRAKYPPEDRDEYDRAYAAASLAGQLAELVYTLRTRASLTQTELARRMGTTQSSIAASKAEAACPPSLCSLASLTPPASVCASPRPASTTYTSAEPPDQPRNMSAVCQTRILG